MGCPKCDQFKYRDVLISHGQPETVDYAKKNRTIVRAWTKDHGVGLAWTADWIAFQGARGAEVMVEYTLGR